MKGMRNEFTSYFSQLVDIVNELHSEKLEENA
jgi:hypothetical protein